MAQQEVKLLGFWASPFAYRVIWALKLKGVDYEYIEEDVFNKSPLLLQLNPLHKSVPVLIHGHRVICESFVIVQYIDETWPQYPLLPQNPYERAMARFWAEFAESKLMESAWMGQCSRGEERERAANLAMETVEKIEELVKGKKLFGGESIGYLDICLGWLSYWLPIWEEVGCMQIIDPIKFPATSSWIDTVLHHPVIRDNLPAREAMIVYFQKRRKDIYESRTGLRV
ncbi:hypothetical protein VitviT2T_006726 [Vitis vinifera]|uniref:Glutathione S-transferase n=2 Tax=Vitis vinifera TaxID=29760 RepID=F6H8P0_VITVI|nr:glutathione transferase GST 23 [Vitis vinifera]WJZ87339.1 hypothetical protein VitviT2T_006726 [Vitis vinifera]|eukprot:XP_002285220.1 PREDICTED: glutathione transferase GST 23 [Vitis vinifera]